MRSASPWREPARHVVGKGHATSLAARRGRRSACDHGAMRLRSRLFAGAREGAPARRRLLALCCVAALAPSAAGAAPTGAATAPGSAIARRAAIDSRALPRSVEAALARGGIPREAMVAWVQEVDATRPRLSWQADKPVNPASLMKLVTTYAGLDLLGPAFTWSTPVWLQGTVSERRSRRRPGHQGQRRSQARPRADLAPDAPRPAGRRARDPRRHRHGPERLRSRRAQPGRLRRRAVPALQRRRRRAAPQLPRRAADDHARSGARRGDGRRRSAARRRSHRRQRAARRRRRATTGAASSRATSASRRASVSPARYQGACGEKVWPLAYADPKSYNERALAGMWAELGGRLGGVVRDGVAPSTTPSFELRSPSLADVVRDINKLSNNVMAQQLFLTLGATQRGTGTPETAREVVERWLRGKVGAGGGERGHRQRLGPLARVAPQRGSARTAARNRVVERRHAGADELAAGRRRRRHAAAAPRARPGART